ncbi:MAG: hypothetical protein FWC38_00250 [Proteobacteria bacterium]|nr:hypothetical protein [Pseudomonadota bacterium]MCL2306674.1 hypothetical protein [Pseudomonadota bacterium]
MDLRNLTLLAIKLLGLYLVFKAIEHIASNIHILFLAEDYLKVLPPLVLFLAPILYVIIGAILLRASGKITNCVIQTEKDASPSLTAYNLLPVAIRIVCLYFIFKSLYSLVYHLAEKILFHFKMNHAYNYSGVFNSHDEAFLLAAIVQFAAALAGWFFAGKIAEFTRKISKDE